MKRNPLLFRTHIDFSNVKCYYATSSVSAINFTMICDLLSAFVPWIKPKFPIDSQTKTDLLNCMRVIYPNDNYVRNSKNGNYNTPLFFRPEYYDDIRFHK